MGGRAGKRERCMCVFVCEREIEVERVRTKEEVVVVEETGARGEEGEQWKERRNEIGNKKRKKDLQP